MRPLRSDDDDDEIDGATKMWNDVFPCASFNYISLPSSFSARSRRVCAALHTRTNERDNAVVFDFMFGVSGWYGERCMYKYTSASSAKRQ